jgi:hypothetical protein
MSDVHVAISVIVKIAWAKAIAAAAAQKLRAVPAELGRSVRLDPRIRREAGTHRG